MIHTRTISTVAITWGTTVCYFFLQLIKNRYSPSIDVRINSMTPQCCIENMWEHESVGP